MRSLGRSDEHGWDIPVFLPGRPARRVGPLHAEQRHFSGYSFGAKRVPLRSLFVIAPQGALLSFEDETGENKRYPPAVSMISCEAKETLAFLNSLAKDTASALAKDTAPTLARPWGAAGEWQRP